MQDLSRIVLKMIASLDEVQDEQKRLVRMTSDGEIEDEEVEDFVRIQDELEKISISIEALQLWTEQMLANGSINAEKYEKARNKRK